MNEQTKQKTVSLEDLQVAVKEVQNAGGFGNVATCSTQGSTAAKAITLGTSFELVSGAVVVVKFTNAITVDNATLVITHTDLSGTTTTESAKPIYYHGAALPANLVQAGSVFLLQYDGTAYNIVGDIEPDISGKQNAITDGAAIGGGIGVSNTVAETGKTIATTAAQTAALTGYVLTKNIPVCIRFTNAIQVVNATLNINSQGAKPIFYLGSKLQPYVVRPNTIITFVYDGTNYNIVAIEGLEQTTAETDLWVDMALPSGTLWAKKNIDVTQPDGFAQNEISYDASFFSFGNYDGHNPNGDAFNYNFSNYSITPGYTLNGNVSPSFDAARVNAGTPWRLPTLEDFRELLDNTVFIDENGNEISASETNKTRNFGNSQNPIYGVKLKASNGNTIFFACVGYGNSTALIAKGTWGFYLTSGYWNDNNCVNFTVRDTSVGTGTGGKYFGYAVRPVM